MLMTCGYRSLAVCTGSALMSCSLLARPVAQHNIRNDDIHDLVPLLSSFHLCVCCRELIGQMCSYVFYVLDAP